MIILCEKKYAEERLQNGFSRKMSRKDLSYLARYFKYLGKNKTQIQSCLIDFCKKFDDDYNEVLFAERIEKATNSIDKYTLRIFRPIGITHNELLSIRSIPDFRYQKILFVMLVIAKMYSSSDSTDFYANHKFHDYVHLAKVSATKSEYQEISSKLNDTGLISTTLNDTYKLNFVDKDQSSFDIVVDDETKIVDFLPFACSVCGKEIDKRGHRHKMCNDCWKEHRKEWDRNRKNA